MDGHDLLMKHTPHSLSDSYGPAGRGVLLLHHRGGGLRRVVHLPLIRIFKVRSPCGPCARSGFAVHVLTDAPPPPHALLAPAALSSMRAAAEGAPSLRRRRPVRHSTVLWLVLTVWRWLSVESVCVFKRLWVRMLRTLQLCVSFQGAWFIQHLCFNQRFAAALSGACVSNAKRCASQFWSSCAPLRW